MLPGKSMEGANNAGPTVVVVRTVPGAGVVAGLGLGLNNVCIKLSGRGGNTPVATGEVEGPAGLGVPIKNDSGNADGTPRMNVRPGIGNEC